MKKIFQKFKRLDLLPYILGSIGIFALGMFLWNICRGEIAAEYFAVLASVVVGWITYQVALSADKSSKIAVDLQKRSHELEERNEAPYIVPMSHDPINPYVQQYVSTAQDENSRYVWIVLANYGSGPAFNIFSTNIVSRQTLNDCKLSFLNAGNTFPVIVSSEKIYRKMLRIKQEKIPADGTPLSNTVTYKDAHDKEWETTFDVVLEREDINLSRQDIVQGTIRITNISRKKKT